MFNILRLLPFIWRNAAASAIHLEKSTRRLTIRDIALIRIDMHLLDSLPRGNLVDGLPRAASIFDTLGHGKSNISDSRNSFELKTI